MEHEQIVKKTSVKVNLPISLTDLIIKDSLKNAVKILANTDICEVEIAGLGKFKISENKLKRRLNKYYNIKQSYEQQLTIHMTSIVPLDEKELKSLNKKLRNITIDISNLERKYLRLKG